MFVFGGCSFGIGEVPLDGAGPPPPDLGHSPDLVQPDLAPDPCGGASAAPDADGGIVGARCVIGAPPTVDGKLDDWKSADFTALNHRNAAQQGGTWSPSATQDDADCSARFALRWDQVYLYFAVEYDDDVRGVHPASGLGTIYLDDAVELYLDGNYDRTDIYGSDDFQFIVSADGRAGSFKNTVLQSSFPMEVLHQSAATGTAQNWGLEMAVPWSLLGGVPGQGRTLGFDLQLDDDDNPGAQVQQHYVIWIDNPSAIGTLTQPAESTHSFGAVQLLGR